MIRAVFVTATFCSSTHPCCIRSLCLSLYLHAIRMFTPCPFTKSPCSWLCYRQTADSKYGCCFLSGRSSMACIVQRCSDIVRAILWIKCSQLLVKLFEITYNIKGELIACTGWSFTIFTFTHPSSLSSFIITNADKVSVTVSIGLLSYHSS